MKITLYSCPADQRQADCKPELCEKCMTGEMPLEWYDEEN